MLHYIYTRPIGWVIGVMALGLVGWGVAAAHIGARRWRRVNLLLAVAALMAIVYATVLSRSEGGSGIILTPFATFTAALQQPELYREMLMNVFLFFPLGLTLSNALPQKWHR